MPYIGVPTTTDPAVLSQDALTYLQTIIPGWVPNDNNLEVWMIMALAQMLATSRDVASVVPDQIFEYFGTTIMGIPPLGAAPAECEATITVQDTAGYTIPAGTQAAFQVTGTEIQVFQLVNPAVIPVGNTLVENALFAAINAGQAGNGLTGAMVPVSPLAYVTSIVATTTTSGGVDPETASSYLSRLTADLQLLSPRPIVPNDFAVLAQSVPGVYRAAAVDGWDPNTQTFGNEREIAVAIVDINGNDLIGQLGTAVGDYLQSLREVNFIVNMIQPTYDPIDVWFRVKPLPNADGPTLVTTVENAITNYLEPSVWGGGDASPPYWDPTLNVIRYLDVATVIRSVIGVAYIDAMTINMGTSDVQMVGPAPLPQPRSITGTYI